MKQVIYDKLQEFQKQQPEAQVITGYYLLVIVYLELQVITGYCLPGAPGYYWLLLVIVYLELHNVYRALDDRHGSISYCPVK